MSAADPLAAARARLAARRAPAPEAPATVERIVAVVEPTEAVAVMTPEQRSVMSDEHESTATGETIGAGAVDAPKPTLAPCARCGGDHFTGSCKAKAAKAKPAGKRSPSRSRWAKKAKATRVVADGDRGAGDGAEMPKRPTTASEWRDLTGELLTEQAICHVPGSIDGGEWNLVLKHYERLPPYVAGFWTKPHPETGEMKRTPGRTISVRLADVPAVARSWALAAEFVARLPKPAPVTPAVEPAPTEQASTATDDDVDDEATS